MTRNDSIIPVYAVHLCCCAHTDRGPVTSCEMAPGMEPYLTAGQGTNPGFVWKKDYSNGTVVEQPVDYTDWTGSEPYYEITTYCIVVAIEYTYKWASYECDAYTMCYICEIDM